MGLCGTCSSSLREMHPDCGGISSKEAGIFSNHFQVSLCRDCIEWAREENRMFLRQALEARLVALFVEQKQYTDGLRIASHLLKELKKIDDKALLVEASPRHTL
jgi:hypothetical protein